MPGNNEISSTEKLLSVIRKGEAGSSSEQGLQPEHVKNAGILTRIRQNWMPAGSYDVIGVEIFRDSLNLVRTTKDKSGVKIVYAASLPMPEKMTIEQETFPPFLKAQIEKSNVTSKKADIWVCLPASNGEIWTVRVPKIRKGLSNAVYWSAKKEKSFDFSEYFFDYRIAGETTENKTKKLLAEVCIASARDVNLYKNIFSGIGLPLKGVSLPSFALDNLFYHELKGPDRETYAVLNIAEESSCIDIHGKDGIFFSRVIRTGKDSIVDSLIREYEEQFPENAVVIEDGDEAQPLESGGNGTPTMQASLSRNRVMELLKGDKDRTTPAGEHISDDDLFEMISPALERLARQLERTIDHSVNVLGNPAPERIYICGVIAFLPKIVDFFGEQLDIRADVLDVLDPSSSYVSPFVFFDDPSQRFSLVSAAGLAMPSPSTLNFLNTAFDRDREKAAMRTTNAVAAGCALLFVATAGYWYYTLHELEQARMKTAALEKRLNEFSPLVNMEMITQMASGHKQEQEELIDYSRKLRVIAVINEINRITPENMRMINLAMDMGRPGEESRRGADRALTIEGFIADDPLRYETLLAGYIMQLRRSPLIAGASISRSAVDASIAGQKVYRFVINIDIEKI